MKKMSSIPAIAAVCMMALSFMLAPLYSFAADIDTIPLTDVKITPSTLNLKSRGTFITSHIALPDPYATELPQPDDVTLRLLIGDNETGEIGALRTGWDLLGRLVVKFSRSEVQELIAENIDKFPAIVTLSLTIDVDNETLAGTDDIRAIKPGKKSRGNK